MRLIGFVGLLSLPTTHLRKYQKLSCPKIARFAKVFRHESGRLAPIHNIAIVS